MLKPDIEGDEMEKALVSLTENADVLYSLANILDRLKGAGILDLVDGITKDYLPTDVDFLGKFFSSKEFTMSIMKTMNVLISVMGAMGSEKNSDLVKGIMYNSERITEDVIDAVNNPGKYSPMKLRKLLYDEDIRTGIAAMVALLKSIGGILRKTAP